MAVVITDVERVGAAEFLYTWTGTPPFTIFVNGRLRFEDYDGNTLVVYSSDAQEPPWLEIIEGADVSTAYSTLYPTTPRIQWRGHVWASHYVVFKAGSPDTELARISETGKGVYSYEPEELDYNEDARYLVQVVNYFGATQGSVWFQITNAGTPLPPSISLSYNETAHTFTVSSR